MRKNLILLTLGAAISVTLMGCASSVAQNDIPASDPLAAAAVSQGYLSPLQALALTQELQLTADQIAALTTQQEVYASKLASHQLLISNAETSLNALFKADTVDPTAIRKASLAVGFAQADLRNTHLTTYATATKTLTADQLATFKKLAIIPR